MSGLAEAYGRQNIVVLAISNFQKAAELDSTSAVIRYKLGKAYYKNRQYNECVREFQAAINLDPTNDLYVFEVADIFYRAKLWRESALFFAKYVMLKKDNPAAYDEYAKALFGGKFYKDALPVLEQAMALNPKVYELKPMLARSEYECGDFQKAVDAYKVLPKDSLVAEDYIRLGRWYAKLKDADNAIVNFEKAIAMDTASTNLPPTLHRCTWVRKCMTKQLTSTTKTENRSEERRRACERRGLLHGDWKIRYCKNNDAESGRPAARLLPGIPLPCKVLLFARFAQPCGETISTCYFDHRYD